MAMQRFTGASEWTDGYPTEIVLSDARFKEWNFDEDYTGEAENHLGLVYESLEHFLEPMKGLWAPSNFPKRTTKILTEMLKASNEKWSPTCAVLIENKQFYCHSLLLRVVSKFFRRDCPTRIFNITCRKLTPRTLVQVYHWLLRPLKSITLTQLLELLQASQYLDIRDLYVQTWTLTQAVLKSTRRILSMYRIVLDSSISMNKLLLPYVGSIWLKFATTLEFVEMEFRQLRRFLYMNSLAVNTEIEVFYTVVMWLDHEWPDRQCYVEELMHIIHWELMPLVFLFTFTRREDGPTAFHYLTSFPTLLALITEAIHDIHALPEVDRYRGNVGESGRYWIYDPQCPYHHVKSCPNARYVGYKQFMTYLASLQFARDRYTEEYKDYDTTEMICCPPTK